MIQNRYGNTLSTGSSAARDAYVDGVDRFLSAEHGAETAFETAIAEDDQFALAHVGVSRCRQASGNGSDALEAFAGARALTNGLTDREASHIHSPGLLIDGNAPAAYQAVRKHALDHPRDAMVAQTSVGVFGLIGFGGQPGREAE